MAQGQGMGREQMGKGGRRGFLETVPEGHESKKKGSKRKRGMKRENRSRYFSLGSRYTDKMKRKGVFKSARTRRKNKTCRWPPRLLPAGGP